MTRTKLTAAIQRQLADVDMTLVADRLMNNVRGFGIAFAAADGAAAAIAPVMQLRPLNTLGSQYELMIYGDIGESWYGSSVAAADVVKQLNELPPTVAQINVRINSYGGSVSDGLAIYNALKRMAATKVVTVDGVAMSIASLIAMAGNTIEMPEASLLMIHAPWGMCAGNSNDMREFAAFLDVYAEAMAGAYVSKSGQTRDEIMSLLTDGKDHTYTAAQASALGFCDNVLADTPPSEEDPTENEDENADEEIDAFLGGMQRFVARQPAMVAAIRAAVRKSPLHVPASGASAGAQPAHAASSGDTDMLRKFKGRLVALAPREKNKDPADGGAGGGGAPAAAAVQPTTQEIIAQAQASLKARNDSILAALKPLIHVKAIAELQTQALSDPAMSADVVNAKALAIMAAHASPTGADPGRIEAGADQLDKDQAAMTNYVLARCSAVAKKDKDGNPVIRFESVEASNPFRGKSLTELAEHSLRAAGVNTARMTKGEIAAKAMVRPLAAAGHTTSDFPNLLENILNKLLVAAYTGARVTWPRFCRTTDLNDFRAHPRYRIGTFSDLKVVNEAGNYEQGTVSDAERESITGQRKGRLLVITREMLVNDDLQAITDIAAGLGGVAMRTIEKDVFALFALNSGNGPTMGDGNPLFDASHNNIAGVAAAPSMASFDAGRVAMAKQKDPSGNDYLDVRPANWLGPMEIGGLARSINRSQYDPDAANKLQKPNIVLNLFNDIIDTPRLSGTAWYMLADAAEEPVFEVGFVGGQREPVVEQDRDFTSDGMRWKVVLEYGTNATGWRGIQKNAGA